MSALFLLPDDGERKRAGRPLRSPDAFVGPDLVSPPLTMYRLCSFLLFRVLEPGSRSCQVGVVRKTGHKAAQADAGNIDKGLTLSLLEKGIGL